MSQVPITPPISTPPPSGKYQRTIISNPDGTHTRLINFPTLPATPDPTTTAGLVLTKDIPISPPNQTWFRVFLPRQVLDSSSISNKLPVIVYYHGGAFVFISAASTIIHDFCSIMAANLTAIVVSVEYRLAPEHRLPAAYEDAIDALHCVKASQEDWLRKFADLSRCFLMGTSSGGNIAYHAGLRACLQVDYLEPLKIRGSILHHPFFGGVERTFSEKTINDPMLTLHGTDFMWELALPVGADRDHEYCNPVVNGGSNICTQIPAVGWKVLVAGCKGDPLIDRQVEFGKMLEGKGVDVVNYFVEGFHGMELTDPSKAEALFLVLKDLIS